MFSSIWHKSHGVCSSAWRSRRRESRGGGRAQQRTRYRPVFERLEDRTVPTTVTTQIQLIDAIKAANTAGGAQTITLGADITLLETTPNNSHDGPNGLPEITNHDILAIAGGGHTLQRSTSTQDAHFRLFDVGSGATLSLKNMTVKNGLVAGAGVSDTAVQGGAIFVDSGGNLSLNQVNLTDNAVTFTGGTPAGALPASSLARQPILELQGGGIYNAGTATIEASSVTGNSAKFNLATAAGKGDDTEADSAGDGFIGIVFVEGGGIYNSGHLTVTSSSISKNSATSAVINGNPNASLGNGDSDGSNDTGGNVGSGNGNGVIGDFTVEGGGIYNADTTMLMGGSVTGNGASSNVTNGSDNGDSNGDSDSNQADGNFNGNGVLCDTITVAGGGIYSSGSMLTATGTGLSGNFAASTVVNGSSNGDGNDVHTAELCGNDNGNGVDGNILVMGGAIAESAGASATLNQCNVSGNRVSSSISNGSNNGVGDGNSNGGTVRADDNGNGVTGSVEVAGGGIDNEGSFTINSGSVSHNSATSFVTNGNNDGIDCGNDDAGVFADDGDGLAGALSVEGGGVHNAGSTMKITSATLSGNSATSTVTNGNNDGGSDGLSDVGNDTGASAGNGVSEVTGSVLVGGGAIANNGGLTVTKCTLTSNSLNSTIRNGNIDGVGDGQNDVGSFDCGNFCGNGVFGNGIAVEVAGGAIVNFGGSTTVTSCSITGNSASSSVTNGLGNGVSDGNNSTGTDGQDDGNGLNGDLQVMGGGTAKLGGTLTLVSTAPTNNSVSSIPRSGSSNLASDGVVVNGIVSVSGQNTFAPVVHAGESLVNSTAALGLPPTGPAPSMMPDSRQPPSPMQGNQRTLTELPASVYETPGPSAHTAIPAVHTPSHSINPDAFFLDPWDELS
jgi:hypothetical protein